MRDAPERMSQLGLGGYPLGGGYGTIDHNQARATVETALELLERLRERRGGKS